MSNGNERRVCVLTGAGGRLGNAFCQRFAADYDIVAICRRRAPNAPSQHDAFIDPLDPHAEFDAAPVYVIQTDLAAEGEVDRVVELVLARYEKVDLLVNNAAETGFHRYGIADGEEALNDFTRYFEVNVGVPMRLAVRFAQRFWRNRAAENKQHNRNIVNVSSVSGVNVYPGGQTLYGSTKAALNHMTRLMAPEFDAFGVRVNALAPTTFPNIIRTETVADAVKFLDADSETGTILEVDEESEAGLPPQ